MIKKVLILSLFAFLSFNKLIAQTQNQTSVWFMVVNNTKFNNKWGLQFDAQIRSADQVDYLRNVLLRPGLTYFIDAKQNVTLGYLLTTTHTQLPNNVDHTLTENRIWQQYIFTHQINSVFASHRLRLEQRFIGQLNGDDIFAQRFRYFFRLIKPFKKQEDGFSKGSFAALQNEVFLNIQNNSLLNNSIFDQNRLYLAAGYRFSKKMDLEVGYMNQALHGRQNNTYNHTMQIALYTRF